jgi:hypothetical protein
MIIWNRLRTINTAHYTVALDWTCDNDPDLSWMDDQGLARIANGEWTNCLFRVAVWCNGTEIAADYLGNSVYSDPMEFAREHRNGSGAYFPDMVRAAVHAARKYVNSIPANRKVV